jgi:hypothetical protein
MTLCRTQEVELLPRLAGARASETDELLQGVGKPVAKPAVQTAKWLRTCRRSGFRPYFPCRNEDSANSLLFLLIAYDI